MSLLSERNSEGEGAALREFKVAVISGLWLPPLLRLHQVLHHPAPRQHLLLQRARNILIHNRKRGRLSRGGDQMQFHVVHFKHK